MQEKLRIFLPFLVTQKKRGRKNEFDHFNNYLLKSERINRENFTFNLGFQAVNLVISQSKKCNRKDLNFSTWYNYYLM